MLRAEIDINSFLEKYADTERFLKSCSQCPNFNKRWSCPEYDFDAEAYWRSFAALEIYAEQLFTEGKSAGQAYGEYALKKRELDEKLLKMEDGGSVSLAAGSCARCTPCLREKGEPCVHPDLMRYSIESLGGNVVKIASELLGTEMKWGKDGQLPEYLFLIGGLLKK